MEDINNKTVAADGVEITTVAPKNSEDKQLNADQLAKLAHISYLNAYNARKQNFHMFWASGAAARLHKHNRISGKMLRGLTTDELKN
jgi:hypothetical protein